QMPADVLAAVKYVQDLLRRSGAVTRTAQPDSLTSRIDRFVLHRYFGFPVFFLVLISLFAAIFWLAQPFMDIIDAGFAAAAAGVKAIAPNSVVMQFLGDGVIAGVGAVAVFFPQIMILFFLMTLLEDSGYLAQIGRAS